MLKAKFIPFTLPLLLLLSSSSENSVAESKQKSPEGRTGTLQKMIVENGNVTMDLDFNRLNGISFAPQRAVTLQFAVAANSFFSILVFNDLLRGPEKGTIGTDPRKCWSGWGQRPWLQQVSCVATRLLEATHD